MRGWLKPWAQKQVLQNQMIIMAASLDCTTVSERAKKMLQSQSEQTLRILEKWNG